MLRGPILSNVVKTFLPKFCGFKAASKPKQQMIVIPGQIITMEDGFLRGHGTFIEQLQASSSQGHKNLISDNEDSDIVMDDSATPPPPPNSNSLSSSTPTDTPASKTALISSMLGNVNRVNKLINVTPSITTTPNKSYTGSTGDLIIGRIKSVNAKKWTVEIGGEKLASLPLTSVNLNDGSQRVRTIEDSMEMRSLFAEGDLVR